MTCIGPNPRADAKFSDEAGKKKFTDLIYSTFRHNIIKSPYEHLCPEVHGNEIHTLYDRHRKVSPNPNPPINTSNFVKKEVMEMTKTSVICRRKTW